MKKDETIDLALTELLQRSFRLMRENDPEADKAFEELTEIAGRMERHMGKCGAEAKQLYDEFTRSMTNANAMESEHAYVQGARDCVCLLRFLGMI